MNSVSMVENSALTVQERVMNIVAQVVERPAASLDLDAHMVTDLGLDSLLALEILALMEKEFKIDIPEEELAQFQRVRQIIEVAERRLAEKQVMQ
jgi:acyl carrier protein